MEIKTWLLSGVYINFFTLLAISHKSMDFSGIIQNFQTHLKAEEYKL